MTPGLLRPALRTLPTHLLETRNDMLESISWPPSRQALALLAAGLLITTTASAQRSAAPTSQRALQEQETEEAVPSEAVPSEATPSARYILHLAHGGTLRTVARQVDGQWQMKRGKDWITLGTGMVTRASKEADVLREMKRRKKALGKSSQLAERVQLAEWMVSEGLVKESLLALDQVLEVSPHQGAALALLGRMPKIAMPSLDVSADEVNEARDALIRWAVQAPISARELAIGELRELEEREELHAYLLDGLGGFSLRRRVFAAQALGRLFPGEDAKRLLQHAVLDTSQAVRRSAAEALGNADDASLAGPVVRALGSLNPRVSLQAAEALGFMGYAAAVEPLINYMSATSQAGSESKVISGYVFFGRQRAYIQDFDVEVATFQAVADPQINVLLEGDVLQAGVLSSTPYAGVARAAAARSSLSRLTGESPGNSSRAWKGWWAENGESWTQRHVPVDETP